MMKGLIMSGKAVECKSNSSIRKERCAGVEKLLGGI